ncbi:hypothetical protein ATANTOWER_012229 [Ataeniobius toweri]|uniref:Uncharacterized protein n=1 Tax=Ataeniobius toweri TaxID=208326 RepID=A0ABU7CB20_9TELE|nr:hypothetical protein [Ataeniobius toweri]
MSFVPLHSLWTDQPISLRLTMDRRIYILAYNGRQPIKAKHYEPIHVQAHNGGQPIHLRAHNGGQPIPVRAHFGAQPIKPAFQPPPVAPKSVGSESTSYAPGSFLRSSPSLSMFIKSRFGGSHTDSLKPNLVARKPPGPSPSSVRTPSLTPSSMRTSGPSPPSEEPAACVLQSVAAGDAGPGWLPGEMRKTIPVQDQRWIGNTLFHAGKVRPDLKI